MGIAENIDWISVFVGLATATILAPLRLLLKGWTLRLLGASKPEVKTWALKAAEASNENTFVQIFAAFRGKSVDGAQNGAKSDPSNVLDGSSVAVMEERSSSP